MSNPIVTPLQARQKLERYCAYQERCHVEVEQKLRTLGMTIDESDEIIAHLINSGYLNETRFAEAFARGKNRFKYWGRLRITAELKARQISKYNIDLALKQLDDAEYLQQFHLLAERIWAQVTGDRLHRLKKWQDYLFRKGYEHDLIVEKRRELVD